MTPHPRTLATTAVVMGLLLTGCTSDPTPTTSGTPTPSASASTSTSASPSGSASPSSTLSPAKQKAVDDAAEAIRAYVQTYQDILADPEPYLNKINDVVTDPQLDRDLLTLQRLVDEGGVTYEATGPIEVTTVEPIKVDIKGEPPTVVLQVCVDRTAVRGTQDGVPRTGKREELQYRVVKTTYLPAPGWAVSKVLPPKGFDQPQPC